ncbi:universal stress protein [Vibrio bivalvicida]|uniref:Universal stress protein n=1 Tax=Vibrio bivalvicida TaxID=1276888 RepID=A0A177Y242_9VIBR|nr:universal stress protein [Vibrio bivalvicida]OAJ94928.1 universal stress protein [Vibrio bivalvicida]
MTFTQLLVPIAPGQEIDDSHHQAFQFANKCSAKVTLLLVIKELAEFKEIYHLSGSSLNVLDKATHHLKNDLEKQARTLSDQYSNIRFSTKVRVGTPFIEIIKEADESDASMIIINSYRQSKKDACERGSNTLNLMRKSEAPIWSLSRVPSSIRNVVVAVDLTNDEYQDFNAQLLSMAIDFCSSVGASLTLCHVWKFESEGFLRDWSGYSDIEIALIAKEMRKERLSRLNALLEVHKDSPIKIEPKVLEGETREVFPKYVADYKMDLVILGSMSRSGISGFVLGNTAEAMINQLDCSVITLKPDTFSSPVLTKP